MSEHVPDDLHYTRTHEWVRDLANGQVEIGITDHAQEALGDLVFVETAPQGIAALAGKYRDDPSLTQIREEIYRARDAEPKE